VIACENNDDSTRGGYARLASLIATRRKARTADGPVLTLDAGDFSMGTAFAAASIQLEEPRSRRPTA
jgi:5'-nucleotidase / UDP-sugar diphosphatase